MCLIIFAIIHTFISGIQFNYVAMILMWVVVIIDVIAHRTNFIRLFANEERLINFKESVRKDLERVEEKKLEKVENSNNEPEERHLEPLEPIEVDTNNKLSDDSKTEILNLYKTSVAKADEAFNEGIYQEAIKDYQKAYDLADNNEEKALCYEGISNVYAKQKRYGSALSYAQKAYNMYPNTSREILLARLYYKTGDLNRATIRMNNVLKRDF